MSELALLPMKGAATRLGFDVTKQNWRVGFHRFLKRSRLPVVRLSPRRFRIAPETIDAFIARRTVGVLPKSLPSSSAGLQPREAA
jgi:hypothetical protein